MANLLKSILKHEPQPSAERDSVAPAAAGNAASGNDVESEARQLVVLGKTLTLKGELTADEDLVLLGRLEGSIVHTGSLTVGPGGVVVGNIVARTTHVKGTVDGDIEASESVVVDTNAIVTGDITAPSVSLVEGARFNGAVAMPSAPQAGVSPGTGGAQRPFDGEYIVSARALDRMLSGG